MSTRKSEGGNKIDPETAMETELIVERVMKFLNLADLKRARGVNKLWRCEGGKAMIRKTCFRIPSKFHKKKSAEQENEQQIVLNFLHPNQSKTLNENGNEQNEDEENGESRSRCRKVLDLRIYNPLDIEILETIQFPYEFVQHFRFPPLSENNNLCGLKKILPSFQSLISLEIVKSGETNGSRISPSVAEIALFEEAGKLDLVKFFEFRLDEKLKMSMGEQVQVLERFAAQTPRLEYIVIGYGIGSMAGDDPALFSRFISALNRTLISSKDSLTVLEMTDCLSDVAGLEIPSLSNVTSLIILLPSNHRIRIPAFSALEESSFSSLESVSIGVLEWDWMYRKVLREVDPSAISVLLPGLNPKIKFSPHDTEKQRQNRNHLLIFSSVPDSDSDSDSGSDSNSDLESDSENPILNANVLLQHVDDGVFVVQRSLKIFTSILCYFFIGPLLANYFFPPQPGLKLFTETFKICNATSTTFNKSLGSFKEKDVLELQVNLEKLEKNLKALEEFSVELKPFGDTSVLNKMTEYLKYALAICEAFSFAQLGVNRLREEEGVQNPVLDDIYRRLTLINSRPLWELIKEIMNEQNQNKFEALLHELNELLVSGVQESRIPALYCEGVESTWKIPPKFICPLPLNSSQIAVRSDNSTNTDADSINTSDNYALFRLLYHPIKCQD